MKEQLQALYMGDFSDAEVTRVECLLVAIDPEKMLQNFGFGQSETAEQSYESLAGLLGESLTDRLASLIAKLLRLLSDADPAKVINNPSWLQRITGNYLEASINYLKARQGIDTLLEETETVATRLEVLLVEINKQQRQLHIEIAGLRLHIAAGRLYMARDPCSPSSQVKAYGFDNAGERFARRLTNLTALLASHEMTAVQLDMAYTQTADLLARYYESSHVLVPIWREHTLTLQLSKKNTPIQRRLAQQAYQALKNNLSQPG